MPSQHLSLRIDSDTINRLDAESRRSGLSRSHLTKILIEEGLRMMRHPGIVFRPGPAGRRPGLAGSMDVWEVARVFTRLDAEGEELLRRTAELTELHTDQVRTAVRYYAEFSNEIDAWISQVDDAAARAESAWQREQSVLRR